MIALSYPRYNTGLRSVARTASLITDGRLLAMALLVPLFITVSMIAAHAEELVFQGKVEALESGVLSSGTDGLLADILFRGGETVSANQPLMQLDTRALAIDIQTAQAAVAVAKAELAQASQQAARLAALSERNVASDASLDDATTTLAAAEANHSIASAQLKKAILEFDKATLRSPIGGLISRPAVAVGTFLEAKAGAPLAEIVQLDPVLVAYLVPYETRIATVRAAGSETLEELFDSLLLTVSLSNGEVVAQKIRPEFASATVQPDTGTVTVFAEVPNPDHILRPGMSVTVTAVQTNRNGEEENVNKN